MTLLLGGFSTIELVVALLIGVMFFGKRLPNVGRSLGQTIVEFKKGMREGETGLLGESRRSPEDPPRRAADATVPATVDAQDRP